MANKKDSNLFYGIGTAVTGGLIAAGVAFSGQLLVGDALRGGISRQVLEAVIPSVRSLGTSVVTASATVIAFMVTMLSISRKETKTLDAKFFKRIRSIGIFSVIALSTSTLLLLFLSVPLQESAGSITSYNFIYYFLIGIAALIAGVMVAIVLMLYNSIQDLIVLIRPKKSYQ